MTDLRAAAQQALEALGSSLYPQPRQMAAIVALKAALAEPVQEPVATVTSETGADISMSWWHEPALPVGTKLYTSPPQRPAEPVQEPVAWGVFDANLHDMFFTEEEAHEMARLKGDGSTVAPLYTATPNDTALLRQALASLRGYRREMGCEQPCDAEIALQARLGETK